MNNSIKFWTILTAFCGVLVLSTLAQVPGVIQYQGRVTTFGTNFAGNGLFKFAILETAVTGSSLWSNDGTSVNGSQPAKSVTLAVSDGLFIVGLGDISVGSMVPVPEAVFAFSTLKLRVWFSDGQSPFVMLTPDQPLTTVPFAMMAANVLDGSITSAKLAAGAVGAGKLGSNTVGSIELADQVSLNRLDILYGGGATGAVVSAQTSEARLQMFDLAGTEVARFGQAQGGGELRLYRTNTLLPIVEIDAAQTTSTGGRISLREADGSLSLLLDGEGPDGGGLLDIYGVTGSSRIRVEAEGGDVAVSGGGLVRIGSLTGLNLALDENEIMSRSNSAAAPLYLNIGSGPVVAGSLAINTFTPATGYQLSVKGKVICEELVVQMANDWPDYVFSDHYRLMPLEEVEAHIQRDRHLPGIPSAETIGSTGVPLGETQRQMMEKIEELTLYLIQQNKRLAAQETELREMRARLEAAN